MATRKKTATKKTAAKAKKAAAPKKAAKKSTAGPKGEVDSIKVRMYCHGFGDCFLLTFLSSGKPVYRMVIDCGMLTGNSDTLRKAIDNINKDCGGKVDVVIQTHEHKDHISGFNLRYTNGPDKNKLLWDNIAVDNVWLAWTEARDDDFANKLRDKKRKKTKALAKALNLFSKQIADPEYLKIMNDQLRGDEYLAAQHRYATALGQVLQFYDIDINDKGTVAALNGGNDELIGLTMKDAMNYFQGRAKNEDIIISHFNPGDLMDEKDTGLKGVRFYFLGPPKNYSSLTTMDDKTHAEMYLTDMGLADNFYMALNNDVSPGESLSPFHKKYAMPIVIEKPVAVMVGNELVKTEKFSTINPDGEALAQKTGDGLYSGKCKSILNRYYYEKNGYRRIEADWLHNAGALALHLDSYTNNTSLVMAIEFIETGKVLLFVGDAQIGNWMSWTEPESETDATPKIKWNIAKNGKKQAVTAFDLLERTVFYKVGHHCSHNATGRKHGLELMTDSNLVAMIPVDNEVAKRQGKKGWKMPAEDLYERLQQKTKGRIIRLDEGDILKHGSGNLVNGAKPTQKQIQDFKKNITESKEIITTDYDKKRPLYIEYEVKSND